MRAFVTRTRRLIRQGISSDFSQHSGYGAVCLATVLQVLTVEGLNLLTLEDIYHK